MPMSNSSNTEFDTVHEVGVPGARAMSGTRGHHRREGQGGVWTRRDAGGFRTSPLTGHSGSGVGSDLRDH